MTKRTRTWRAGYLCLPLLVGHVDRRRPLPALLPRVLVERKRPLEELSSPATVPVTESLSGSPATPLRRRRRRSSPRESDSSLSSERRPRRRRRATVPDLGLEEVGSASPEGGMVPPSSPAAIVTVPGRSVGPMSEGAGSLYRTALRRLLRLAPVPRSGRAGDEDPESDPDSEDGWFMTVVTVLESYRTRPSSRTGRGRQRVSGLPMPRSLTELLAGVDRPFSGGWAAIPPGFVSEWFPRRPATSGRRVGRLLCLSGDRDPGESLSGERAGLVERGGRPQRATRGFRAGSFLVGGSVDPPSGLDPFGVALLRSREGGALSFSVPCLPEPGGCPPRPGGVWRAAPGGAALRHSLWVDDPVAGRGSPKGGVSVGRGAAAVLGTGLSWWRGTWR